MGGAISVYNFKKGILKRIQRIFTHPKNSGNNFKTADIHLSPDERFLYASNRESQNNIAIFSIIKNGKLKVISYDSTYGIHPRNFAIDPTGKFLIVTNQISGNLVCLKEIYQQGCLRKPMKI